MKLPLRFDIYYENVKKICGLLRIYDFYAHPQKPKFEAMQGFRSAILTIFKIRQNQLINFESPSWIWKSFESKAFFWLWYKFFWVGSKMSQVPSKCLSKWILNWDNPKKLYWGFKIHFCLGFLRSFRKNFWIAWRYDAFVLAICLPKNEVYLLCFTLNSCLHNT